MSLQTSSFWKNIETDDVPEGILLPGIVEFNSKIEKCLITKVKLFGSKEDIYLIQINGDSFFVQASKDDLIEYKCSWIGVQE